MITLDQLVAEVTIPVPQVPGWAGFAVVMSALVAVGGLWIRYRGRQIMDWGDLIERQEKIIVQQDAKIARLEAESERRRRALVAAGLEVPDE